MVKCQDPGAHGFLRLNRRILKLRVPYPSRGKRRIHGSDASRKWSDEMFEAPEKQKQKNMLFSRNKQTKHMLFDVTFGVNQPC